MKKVYIISGMIAMVWLIVQFPHAMINPGELTEGHQDMNNKCFDCHDPFMGVSNDKCISCHKLSDIGTDSTGTKTSLSFHTKLATVDCNTCHTDHKGIHPTDLIRHFDHSLLPESEIAQCSNCHGKPTDQMHTLVSSDCGSCHITDGWTTSVKFDHDLIVSSDRENCSSCHLKPDDAYHQSVTGKCSECHTTLHWVPSTFDHSAYFIFDKHHTADCKTCHTNNDYSAYTCYGCHEHSESNIREEHLEEGIADFSDCASCHHSGDEDDAEKGGGNKKQNKGNEADQIKNYLDKQEGRKDHEGEDD